MELSNRITNLLYFNGIDGRTGESLYPPMDLQEVLTGLRRLPRNTEKAVGPGIDPRHLAETGWAVVFHENESPELREALRPLLDRRKAQATQRFEHFYRELTFRDGMNKESFLSYHGATLGQVNPHRMPYFLLLVGEPDLVPFHFQHQLDIQYAVGRICFDTPEEYGHYARSVVEAETGKVVRDRRVALFGVRNPDDTATKLCADHLVRPLLERLSTPEEWQEKTDWQVHAILEQEAKKERLSRLLGGEDTPALLFTASHGMGFACGDPLQRDYQGALLCQDWPGPKAWKQSVPRDHYFSGDDLGSDAKLHGLVAFHFACHGVGVPAIDEFARHDGKPPRRIALKPFVPRLPQRLLGHPGGSALAVIGHVERAWAYSFLSQTSTSQIEAFDSTLRLLMEGYPVGYAMEYFNQKYAELSADLTLAFQRMGYGETIDQRELAGLWIANNDARNYAVIGDPAVRVAVG